jgi:pre-mRNA-splicing factor SYF1
VFYAAVVLVHSVDVEGVIRAGIRRFTDETGRLWCALADYFIRLGVFEKARDVYEEGMAAVMTVRDFTIVFDAYALYEETMLAAKIDLRNESVGEESEELNEDIDLRLARLERLMDTRPQLLSLVLLRQNPHNVHEWLKRTKVCETLCVCVHARGFRRACWVTRCWCARL